MPMNKVKGNMYPWLTNTENIIKGVCEYNCIYCYYQNNPYFKPKIGKLRLDEKKLKENLGKGNVVFMGSSTDMWADSIPKMWIELALDHCREFDNTYLFQTKNPKRCLEFMDPNKFPKKTILGITLETNEDEITSKISKAPRPSQRVLNFLKIEGYRKMVSIEPLLSFNCDILSEWIKAIKPEFVSIGADSKKNNLPEPSYEEVEELIKKLKGITKVKIKPNLKRLRKC